MAFSLPASSASPSPGDATFVAGMRSASGVTRMGTTSGLWREARLLQPDLFGWVRSDSTVFRAFHELSEQTAPAVAGAMAEVRAKVWARWTATTGNGPVILDIDGSLVGVHSENKQDEAPLQGPLRVPPDALLRRRHR